MIKITASPRRSAGLIIANISVIIGLLLLSLTACKKDEIEIVVDPNLPKVVTHPYSDLTYYSVKISGTVTSEGSSKVTEAGFIADTLPNPTVQKNAFKSVRVLNANGEISMTLTRFSDFKIYLRAYAINASGVSYGEEIQFKGLKGNEFPGAITVSTQREVVELGKNRYTHIGQLEITGSVEDLSPLSDLTTIGGSLIVRNTTALTSFKGLEHFEMANEVHLFNGIYIENNEKLSSLTGLEKMTESNGLFYIRNNDQLKDLRGLDNLDFIHGGDLLIEGCDNLTSLTGLEKFRWLNGNFILSNNPKLVDLKALRAFNFTTDRVKILNNASLRDVFGFESLHKVEGIEIYDNPMLANLGGFAKLDTISEAIMIQNNLALNDISALSKIRATDYISISNCPSLVSLAGLENVRNVKHQIYLYKTGLKTLLGLKNVASARVIEINNNENLKDLQGLNGLDSLEGDTYTLLIHSNAQLTNLAGLENLKRAEGNSGSIQIIDNPMLNNYCGLKQILAGNWAGFFNVKGNLSDLSRSEIVNKCK